VKTFQSIITTFTMTTTVVSMVVTLIVTTTAVSAASNMIFKQIDVQMGPVGSDDDIRIKICDLSKCCTTKKLSNTFGSEWKAGKLETWDGRDLGNCTSILFDDKLGSVEVSIVKELKKKDPLDVSSMVLSGQVGSDKKNTQKFKCGAYKFSAKDAIKSNFCSNEKSAPRTTKRPASPVTTKRPSAPLSSGGLPNLQLRKVVVQVGARGTDNDVTMQVCDLAKCCTTKKLSHTLSSEWVKNKKETWDGRKLGNCSNILFRTGAPSLEVSVIKTIGKKKLPLDITSILLEAAHNNDKKKIEKFKCGAFRFSGTDSKKSNFCQNENSNTLTRTTARPIASLADLENFKINNVVVQMGDDGTNDDISLEICNAKSALTCCDTGKLSSLLSNDWSKNDKETWKNKDLGQCKTKPWNACRGFDVAVKKKSGKDSLKIKDITLELVDQKDAKKTQKFLCSNYNIGSTDTVKRNTCVLQGSPLNCPKAPVTTKRTTKSPLSTGTRTGPCLRNGKNCDNNNVILKELDVQIGRDGTTDKVSAKVCTPDQKTCCSTLELSARTGNNWVRNGNTTWKGSPLGLCRDFQFITQPKTTVTNLQEIKLVLTLNKPGKNGMRLTNFNINAKTPSGQDRIFQCGKIDVVDSNTATKECVAKFGKKSLRTTTKKPKTTTTRPPFRSGSG